MADFCGFCNTRRPEGGTNMVVLNGGSLWLEFCPSCGDKEILTNSEGKHQTVKQVFDGSKEPAPSLVVAKHFAKINLAREASKRWKAEERKFYRDRAKALRAERDAKRNLIGNMFPELAKLKG